MRKLILLLLLPIFSFAQTRQTGGISFTPQWNYKISGSDTTWQFGNTLINQFPYFLTKWQSDQRYAPIAGGVPSGGATGQVLQKLSNTDYDTDWVAKFAGLSAGDITTALGFIPDNPEPIKLGSIISDNWPNLSKWTVTGSGFSVASNQLIVTSAASSIGFGNYIGNTSYSNGTSNLENVTIYGTANVGTVNSTSFGFAVGFSSLFATQVQFACDATNGGRITIYYNGVADVVGASKISISTNDNINYKVSLIRGRIVATLTNTTTGASITETKSFTGAYAAPSIPPAAYRVAIWALGGTQTLGPVTVTSDEFKNPDYAFFGDSRWVGLAANTYDNRTASKLSAMYNGKFTVVAGAGDVISQVSSVEGLNIAPLHAVIDIGVNNITTGTSLASFQTQYAAKVAEFVSGGYVLGTSLFVSTIIPTNIADVSTFNAWIRTTYGTAVIDQATSFAAASGTGINALYSGDGLHLNALGMQKQADIIATYFNLIKKANYQQENLNVSINPINGFTGIGKDNPFPRYTLDVLDQSNGTQLNLRNSVNDLGVYMGAYQTSSLGFLGRGVNYTNSNWLAKAADPVLIQLGASTIDFAVDAGKTLGSSYTPTTVLSLTSANTTVNNVLNVPAGNAILGTFKTTSISTTAALLMANLTYNAGFTYTNNGAGTLLSLNSGEFQHIYAPTGIAGAVASPTVGFKTNIDGSFAAGASLSSTVGNYTGAGLLYSGPTGNLLIGTTTDNGTDKIQTPGNILGTVLKASGFAGGKALFSSGTSITESGTTSTELSYLSGVTSAIQTQLNLLAPKANPTFTGTMNAAAANFSGNVILGTTANSRVLNINGGNTNAGDGSRIGFGNGVSTIAFMGNYSTIVGGAYDGRFTISTPSAPLYLNLYGGQPVNVASLTASQLVATDGSKNLVSVTALPSGTTATTQSASDNSTKVATTAYVDAAAASPIIKYQHQIFTPTTGGTVNLTNGYYNIINPAATLLALTVNLPSSPANNDVVYIKFTQAITTVTYGNGTVVDGITAPTAGALTVLTYDSGTTSWY